VVSLKNDSIITRYANDMTDRNVVQTRNNEPHVFYRDRDGQDWIGYLFLGIDYTMHSNNIFHCFPLLEQEPMVRGFNLKDNAGVVGTESGILKVDGRNVQRLGGDLSY